MLDELATADDAVGACVDAPVWALPEPKLVAALDAVHGLEQRLAAVKLSLVREVHGRGTAVAAGASSTAVRLRDRLRLTVPAARRLVETAAAVDAAPPPVRDALGAGSVTAEQARIIADTVATVARQAGAPAAETAVGLLVDWAGQFEATLLRRLATRILDHVAPDLADAAARTALDAEAAHAERRRTLQLSDLHDGRLRLTGSLDAETGAVLRAALEPLTAPAGPGDTRSPGQRRHDALAEVCRLALRAGELPEHGGEPPQIVVTTGYDALTGQLSAGTLDTGHTLSPDTVRRLACDAGILPAVLGGTSQVLDVGQQRRLIAGPLRRAPCAARPGLRLPRLRPAATVGRRPPRPALGRRRADRPAQRRSALPPPPPPGAPRRLGRAHRRRRTPRVPPTRLARPWLDPDRRPRRNQYHRRT